MNRKKSKNNMRKWKSDLLKRMLNVQK